MMLRLIKKIVLCLMVMCIFSIFGDKCEVYGSTLAELKRWNRDESFEFKKGNVTFTAILSIDKSEAWIYRVDVTEKTKKLIFPETIEGATVTKIGYDYTFLPDDYGMLEISLDLNKVLTESDYEQFLDYNEYDMNFVNIFGNMGEGYHDDYAYSESSKNIKKMVLPSQLKSILPGAFSGMVSLEQIVIPDKISLIPNEAFAACKNLKEVQLPASLEIENIDSFLWAFPDCKKLNKISISEENEHLKVKNNSLLSKDGKILYSVVLLDREYKIPKSVTTIKHGALEYCKAEKIYLGKKIKKIEGHALTSKTAKEIIVDKKNKNYKSYKQYILNKKDKSIAVYILNGEETLKIQSNVKKLTGDYSVCGKKQYKKMIIPKSVKKVVGHWSAFHYTKIYFESKTPPKQIMKNLLDNYKILPWAEDMYVPKNSRDIYKEWYEQIDDLKVEKGDITEY